MCLFKFTLCEKLLAQMVQSCFLPSCTDNKCLFKCWLCVKLALQSEHLKGFSPSWIDSMCLFNIPFLVKLLSTVLFGLQVPQLQQSLFGLPARLTLVEWLDPPLTQQCQWNHIGCSAAGPATPLNVINVMFEVRFSLEQNYCYIWSNSK